VKNEKLQQLTVTFQNKDKQFIEESVCNRCDTEELYRAMNRLVHRIVANDGELTDLYRLKVEKETSQEALETGTNLRWHITASSVALVALWQSASEAQKHNEYVDENEKLKSRLESSTSSAEISSLKSEISENESKIETHKQNFYIFTAAALGSICWEIYLLYDDFWSQKEEVPERQVTFNIIPQLNQTELSLTMRF